MSGNGGKASQPSLPAISPVEGLDPADLQGVVETIANKTEYMGHCLDKLGDASIAMKAELYDLKVEVQRLAKNVDMLPSIKQLLVEALSRGT